MRRLSKNHRKTAKAVNDFLKLAHRDPTFEELRDICNDTGGDYDEWVDIIRDHKNWMKTGKRKWRHIKRSRKKPNGDKREI